MKKPVIAVLFGGCSAEYKVSLQSAAAILRHWNRERYTALPVGITREGEWFHYTGPAEGIADGSWHRKTGLCRPCMISPNRLRRELVVFTPAPARFLLDGAFPVLHGRNGEDGTVQGLLELAGIPIIGCGTLSSALCMDKARAHRLAEQAGVRAPRGAVFERGSPGTAIAGAAESIGYPLFVKPVRAGSSFGVSRVAHREELAPAVEEAARHDAEILLEEAVEGFEVGCAVLGNDTLTIGMVDEVELSGGFFSYEEKYTLRTSVIHCPARISEEKAAEIRRTAAALYRALGCRVFARVDLFLKPDGEVVFNEINTIPGFTAHSRYPAMMRGAGWEFGPLVDRLIALGLEA